MANLRLDLQSSRYGELTQGSVFCCAQASRYKGCKVYGLAITARCDVAQNKHPVLNYLPIVNLSDWLRRDGLDILVENQSRVQDGRLRSMLREAEVSEFLAKSISLEEIGAVHFPLDSGSKSQKAKAKKFHDHAASMSEFNDVKGSACFKTVFEWFRAKQSEMVEDLVRRLSRHAVLGHYFLETLSPHGEENEGYVCLLREVATLPKSVAEKIGKGLDCTRYGELCVSEAPHLSLSISSDELAMPVVQIVSPTIEHVLQSFSNLFGRIGVADPVDEVIRQVIEKCLEDGEGNR